MEFNQNIYAMDLHDIASSPDTNSRIMRVPGGWIYANYHTGANQIVETFVPFNNEFQATPPLPQHSDIQP